MTDPSQPPPPTESDSEFARFMEETLPPGPIRLTPERRAAVLAAFAAVPENTAATAPPRSRRRRCVRLWTPGLTVAASIALLFSRPPAPPRAPVAPAIAWPSATPALQAAALPAAGESLDEANFQLAVLNDQVAGMERRLAWLTAASEARRSSAGRQN